MPLSRGTKLKKANVDMLSEENKETIRRSSRKKVSYAESDDDFQCEGDSGESEDNTEESESEKSGVKKNTVSKAKLSTTKNKNMRNKKTKLVTVQESKSLSSMFKPGNNVIIQSQLDLSDTDSDSCSDAEPSKVSTAASSPIPAAASTDDTIDYPEEAEPAYDINLWKQNLEALEVKPKLEPEEPEELNVSKKGKILKKGVAKLLKLAGEKKEESSSEDENWEKIDEKVLPVVEEKLPAKNVEVTIDLKLQRRSKKERDLQEMLRLQVNRIRKQVQIDLHKASLVGALAHGYLTNKILNDETLIGSALSVIPSAHCYPPKRTDMNYVEKLVKWFKQRFVLAVTMDSSYPDQQSLLKCISTGRADSVESLVYACVILCRSLGILCRFVVVLQPLSSKVDRRHLEAKNSDEKGTKDPSILLLSDSDDDEIVTPKEETRKGKELQRNQSNNKKQSKGCSAKNVKERKVPSKSLPSDSDDDEIATPKEELRKGKAVQRKQSKASSVKIEKERKVQSKSLPSDSDDDEIVTPKEEPRKGKTVQRKQSKTSNVKIEKERKVPSKSLPSDSDDDEIVTPKKGTRQRKEAQRQQPKRKKKDCKQKSGVGGLTDHSDSESEDFKKKKRKTVSRQPAKPKQSDKKNPTSNQNEAEESADKKTKSSAKKRKSDEYLVSGEEPKKAKRIVSCWMEIYLEDEEQWTSVDVVSGKFHCDRHLERLAPEPMLYVMAFNPDTTWKDVTQRYASSFLSTTRKQRVDPDAWSRLLKRNTEAPSRRSKAEDETLQRSLVEQPLPTSISEYKAHPLYALKRHLLKFEAVYPANCTPLGCIRGEAVYARESVKNLHSRETWLKEAKVVRIGEEPYKVVKARPKWDRPSKKMVTDIPLELYGDWQIEDYIPPPAVNGQVPRNAYGNVELFLPKMLPGGTKHLQIPGLNKVARKLGIDCAPAMTGWDFHGGWSHPVYDGFVVCDEHVESLMDAWQEFNQEQEKREREKREKRVYGNWRKLIRGLLIKQRLEAKYFSKLTEMDDFTNEMEIADDKPQSSNRCNSKNKLC